MKKRTVTLLVLFAVFTACITIPFQAGAASSIRIFYKCYNTNTTSNTLAPWLKVVNDGPDTLTLSQVTIRYWYTRDNDRPQSYVCDHAVVGTANVLANCVPMNNPTSTADYYLEVGFTAGAGTVSSGNDSGEIQFRIHNDIWSDYNQANDYSFNASMTTFTENTNITAYINGVLVYGTEPTSTSTTNGFLVIVSKPLYDTGLITTTLNTYLSDLTTANWAPLMITVDNTSSSNPDHVCANPAALKTVIQTYYNQGYVGFVLIGSDPAIPTAFWRYNQNPDEMICPTDLFYADMDAWTDYNGDGVYDSYDASDNFYGSDFAPELFWGRISAGCITSSINEEAAKIASYLNKIHLYRTNGSNLTPAQQERMLVFYDQNDFKGNRGVIESFQGLTTKIHGFFDDSITTRDKLKTELENGYQFAQYAMHSCAQFHDVDYWNNDVKGTEQFDLTYLNSLTPRVHYLNMYSCDACYFRSWTSGNVPNIGATYIFNNDYVLNITGSTGHWGFMPDATYWSDINEGRPIGEVIRDYFTREINRTINPEVGCPKGVLLGDPTLTYSVPEVTNKMPYITTNLAGERDKARPILLVNHDFTIESADPEGDPVTVTVTGLPGGTLTGTNQVIWTPSSTGIYQATVTASDRTSNLYQEEFSVKVIGPYGGNLIQNYGFESTPLIWSTTSWHSNCTMEKDDAEQRSGTYSAKIYSSTENDCRFEQSVNLSPNTYYLLSGYIQTQSVSGGQGATLSVEFPGEFPISSTAVTGTNSSWQYVSLFFYSGNHTSASFQCRLGMYGATSSGTAWFDDITLTEMR